jgi:hypothetical protein
MGLVRVEMEVSRNDGRRETMRMILAGTRRRR